MENDGSHRRFQTVVMFPYITLGHLRPFLPLADRILRSGYGITLIATPHNKSRLRQSLPVNVLIDLVEIPFTPSDHGLPPEIEKADSIPPTLIIPLVEASLKLKAPFRTILEGLPRKPLCVISDLLFSWAADIAHDLGIMHAIFCSSGGFALASLYSLWMNPPYREAVRFEFCIPDFPQAGYLHVRYHHVSPLLPSLMAAAAGGNDQGTKFHRENFKKLPNSDAVLFNTVEDIDGPGLDYFRRKLGIPIFPIGPVLRPRMASASIQNQECIHWLEKHHSKSVLYISFGSQRRISSSQTTALAKALESTGRSFIWIIQPPIESSEMDDFLPEQWLPDGYLQRIHNKQIGLILKKRAPVPQGEILAHRSVSTFMSHCGWNSITASLVNGVPLIAWPLWAKQLYNSKYLVDQLGVAVRVARGSGSEVTEEEIVEKIEMVMGENNGQGIQMRKRAEEVKRVIEDAMRDEYHYKGSSVRAMEQFLVYANSACF